MKLVSLFLALFVASAAALPAADALRSAPTRPDSPAAVSLHHAVPAKGTVAVKTAKKATHKSAKKPAKKKHKKTTHKAHHGHV